METDSTQFLMTFSFLLSSAAFLLSAAWVVRKDTDVALSWAMLATFLFVCGIGLTIKLNNEYKECPAGTRQIGPRTCEFIEDGR